jgi:hypothetical protein
MGNLKKELHEAVENLCKEIFSKRDITMQKKIVEFEDQDSFRSVQS